MELILSQLSQCCLYTCSALESAHESHEMIMMIILFYMFPHVLHHLLRQYLELMDWAVRLREPLNVTILNQAEVKYYELLVVLFRNPFIDAMESKKKKKKMLILIKKKKLLYIMCFMGCRVLLCKCNSLITAADST